MKERLGVDRFTIVNDFGAVAHAVATLAKSISTHLCGPDQPLPAEGVISSSARAPGWGSPRCSARATIRVIATEGGHIDFAPLDTLTTRSSTLRGPSGGFGRARRVRAGLVEPLRALGAIEGRDTRVP